MYYMLNNKKDWIILIDILISVSILSIFYLWLFHFSEFNTKISDLNEKNKIYSYIYSEVKEIFPHLDTDFENWNYIMYYTNTWTFVDWKYFINKIYDDKNIYDWSIIDSYGNKKNFDTQDKNYLFYKRNIFLESIINPFLNTWTNAKKVKVSIIEPETQDILYENSFLLYNNLNYYE